MKLSPHGAANIQGRGVFEIRFDGRAIGNSALELGDPPMGVALGEFVPMDGFSFFKNSVSPEKDDDPDMKRWVGLSVLTPDGHPIPCHDVVLFECDLGGQFEFEVSVLGIDGQLYEELFPEHIRAYENQFK